MSNAKSISENGTRHIPARTKRRRRVFAERAGRRKVNQQARQLVDDPRLLESFVSTEPKEEELRRRVFGS